MELGLRIPIVSGILDSLNCILDSKAQDSELHKKNFPHFRFNKEKVPRFRNPDSLTWSVTAVMKVDSFQFT